MAAALPVTVPRAPAGGVLALTHPIFVSDLHLSTTQPRTLARFVRFLLDEAAEHAELLILGDLFEYWLGDDVVDDAGAEVIAALRQHSAAGHPLYLMHGNRDLLLGANFAAATGGQLLPDPTVAELAGHRLLLAHGDAWCTGDARYQRLRSGVRRPWVQRLFLSLPQTLRRRLVGRARAASETSKRSKPIEIMDITASAVDTTLHAAAAATAIHGHTHRPALHWHSGNRERWVLSDWDYDATPPRGGYLHLEDGTPRLVALAA